MMDITQLIIICFAALGIGMIALYFYKLSRPIKPYYHHVASNWQIQNAANINPTEHAVFLIGDTGAPAVDRPDEVLELLKLRLHEAGENSTVIFLGDIVYPIGLPSKGHKYFELAHLRLKVQLDMLDGYRGNIYFLSGNHDWNKTREEGFDSVIRQQKFIEGYLNRENVYLPPNGCPGPIDISLTPDLTLIIINTTWWVHRGYKPIGSEFGCVDSEQAFFEQFDAILEENKNKDVIVAAHHPLYSKAFHGGKFNLKTHLFPLTFLHDRLYLPLPVVGSLYPVYRKFFGAVEDMSHPVYKRMRKKMVTAIANHPNLIWAAGHDHNLQYIHKNDQHHIVSGAGSKAAYVRSGGSAIFTHAHKGFFKLEYKHNSAVWLQAWEPRAGKPAGELSFSRKIF